MGFNGNSRAKIEEIRDRLTRQLPKAMVNSAGYGMVMVNGGAPGDRQIVLDRDNLLYFLRNGFRFDSVEEMNKLYEGRTSWES